MTSKCPYCAEEIRTEAIKCKHCGSGLAQHRAVDHPSGLRPTGRPQSGRRYSARGAWLIGVVVVLGLAVYLLARRGAQPEATQAAETPEVQPRTLLQATAMARALRSSYPILRRAEVKYNEANTCARGVIYERRDGSLQYTESYERCQRRCNDQTCHGLCYQAAGGKRTGQERAKCWTAFPTKMKMLIADFPTDENSDVCTAQVVASVRAGLVEASKLRPEPGTGFVDAFPWGTVHDGFEPCARKLFKCGLAPCSAAGLARVLGLREPELMPSPKAYAAAAGRLQKPFLHLATGEPIDLSTFALP